MNIFINRPNLIVRSLDNTKRFYRFLDPGWYLYRKVVLETNIVNKFNDEFIELVYVTLVAWNMNSRGAKLADFNVFKTSLLSFKDNFINLSNFKLEELSSTMFDDLLNNDLLKLFFGLELVANNKPKLVTYSKTFHFFLPNLFVPIDRKYTLNYFNGHTNIPKSIEKQFDLFKHLHQNFRKFSNEVSLNEYLDQTWNANIPKTIDNIIIGYQL